MSEWKEGSAQRRDRRHTKDDITTPHRSSKNTRKWCKGRVGVHHVTKEVVIFTGFMEIMGGVWCHEVCEVCGKNVRKYARKG